MVGVWVEGIERLDCFEEEITRAVEEAALNAILNMRSYIILIATLICVSKNICLAKKRSWKEWNELNLDTELQADDDEVPLMTRIAELEAKRKDRGFKDETTGPMILFVTLKHDAEDLERSAMLSIARIWLSKLQSNSLIVEIQLFNKNELLVKILHGWMVDEIQRFLLDQEETLFVLRDKKKIPGRKNMDL